MRQAAYEIIKRKGATNHAIGLVTASLLRSLLRDENRILNLSTVISGDYGLSDVAISLPSLVSREGVSEIIKVDMNDSEKERFLHSVEVIRKAIASTDY